MWPDLLGGAGRMDKKSYADYLRKSAVPREELEVFLHENSWAQFDPEVVEHFIEIAGQVKLIEHAATSADISFRLGEGITEDTEENN